MRNVQISFDENLLDALDRLAASAKTSRSALIREALKRWIQEREIKEFEEQWIQSIKKNPDGSKDADIWADAQEWSD
ncbi:MAG: ribbon-helix-helix protein, CopG family [Deltaproteobacteria bacterium]|nr:ribbon-helix-helix protein, CopG family [Deltaproteobacteria bacterium]MBW1924381.1 ribbon-helix-helix protein, CopG family [Deltaproteobacteria bacterium]MBW1949373.1 ribbon-helix-helix protein, CopG family [Deltaproteobacteria bacterium]MBW2007694.1 ribbon-helix-helix protein, CopG family [Deltaproteobacteria bacterium]